MDELLHKEFKEVGISLSSITLSKGMQPKNFFHFLFRQPWVPCDKPNLFSYLPSPKAGIVPCVAAGPEKDCGWDPLSV